MTPKLSLSYCQGNNNTISVADKDNIFLGNIRKDMFGRVCFESCREDFKAEEVNELNSVIGAIQQYILN